MGTEICRLNFPGVMEEEDWFAADDDCEDPCFPIVPRESIEEDVCSVGVATFTTIVLKTHRDKDEVVSMNDTFLIKVFAFPPSEG